MIKVRLSKTAFVFLIFLTVAELFQAGVISGWHLTAVMISVFIFACGLLLLIKNGSVNQSCEVKPAIFVVSQWLVFILYNFVLYLVGVGETIFMKSSMIQVTLPFFILSGGWGFYYIFKNNALRYFRYSIFINFLLVIVIEFFQLGPLAFLKGIASVFSGLSVENPLEKSFDAVFAIGLYFIYMFNMKNFENKPTKRSVIFLAFFMILCGKRSQCLSLACLALFSFLTSFVKEKNLYKFETIASIAIVIVYYCYIFLISNNTLLSYLYSIGINSMGRFQMWAYVGQFLEFSPSYFGHGYSFSTLMLEKKHIWTYNGAVFGLHGGILGFYTDMGFIMFGLWMIFNLIVIPKHFRKKYGFQVTNLYWALTVYLFILYITESTINHFITQSLYMIILLHAINLNEMKKN